MEFSLSSIDQQVTQAVRYTFGSMLEQRRADLTSRVNAFGDTIAKGKALEEQDLLKFAAYKEEVDTLIREVPLHDGNDLLALEYKELLETLDQMITLWPESLRRTQDAARYYRQPEDSLATGTRKFLKRALFLLSKLPRKAANIIRKLAGKPVKAISYNTHTVPLQGLGEIYLREELVRRLLGQTYALLKLEARIYEMLFVKEDKLKLAGVVHNKEDDLKKVHQLIDEQYESIQRRVEEIVGKVLQRFEAHFAKAGTFELKSRMLTPARAAAFTAQNRKSLASMAEGWKLTHQTLLEDWQLNVQLRRMTALVRLEYATLDERISEKKATILESFEGIRDYLVAAKQRASKESPSAELRKLLVKEKYEASKSLNNRLLKGTIEALINQNFAALVHRLDTRLNELYHGLPEKTAILKSGRYDEPIKSSDLQYFSPHELFAFESMPDFEKATVKLRQLITRRVDELVAVINDLDDIVTFCLDSAMESLEQQDADPTGSLQVYREGLDRAINKLDDSAAQLAALKSTVLEESHSALEVLITHILELTSNENARELNMRISKGKALRSKEQYMDRARALGTRLTKQLTVRTWRLRQHTGRVISFLRSAVGVSGGEQKVSSEVSDFLADSFSLINELPIVYQRLYKISALTDQGLFEGRSSELIRLKSAYQSWEAGKHAPTVLVGEKWSGLTSLINHFLDKLQPKLSIIKIDHQHNISTDVELMAVFSSHLKAELTTPKEVIDHILGLPAKKIMVVENLQYFFLRKVHGFEALKTLFTIIAQTDQKVYWLLSCTAYGWHYLEATNSARDHFRHLIQLEPITNDQMIELIMKRNRISGYRVAYETTADLKNSKKFNRLAYEQQQQQLKANFFNNLIKFSKSNVSLGLIFWLLSTKEISEDTITIGSFKEPDLSFLGQLSMPKVFILNNLILHDGLTVEQLAEVMRMSIGATQSLVTNLEDDGVLITRELQYMINPFVYRQIVNHLKLKNLIH